MAKKKANVLKKPQRHCIFCGGYNLSKQHLWPAWMGRDASLPTYTKIADAKSYFNVGALVQQLRHGTDLWALPITAPTKAVKNVSLGTQKLLIVCVSCNNGWMSQIEDNCHSIVKELILEQAQAITPQQQLAIATWATLMTIVAEFTHTPNKAISYAERADFFAHRIPANHFNIFVGKYQESKTLQQYLHTGHEVVAVESQSTVIGPLRANFQSSIFIMGSLVIYVLSTSYDALQPLLATFTHPSLIKLWPSNGVQVDWLNLPGLYHADINALHEYSWKLTSGIKSL